MFGGENSASGVARKFFNQASALSRLGLDLELVLVIFGDVHYPSCDFLTIHRLKDVPPGNFLGRIKRAHEISKIFDKTIGSLGPEDVLYYRYSGSFPLYYPNKFLRQFRACKIVAEFQTKELDEFKLNNNALSYWSDYLFGKVLREQSDAIIGVTDEITRYEISRSGDPKNPILR